MFIVLGGLLYLSAAPLDREVSSDVVRIVIRLVLIVATVVWVRCLAAVVVRSSIDRSIRIAQKEISRCDNPENIIMVGFSWGGAVSQHVTVSPPSFSRFENLPSTELKNYFLVWYSCVRWLQK
jgi:hypothetical protein